MSGFLRQVQDDASPSSGRRTSESSGHATRQAIMYCPYCAEETLFPIEEGWECRSCLRAFSIRFLGLRPSARADS